MEPIAQALRRVVAPELQAFTADEHATMAVANARTAELLASAPQGGDEDEDDGNGDD